MKWYEAAAGAGSWAGKEARTGAGGKRRDQWLLSAWGRNGQARFLAACIAELSDACGGLRDEWGTLTEKEQMALFNFFAVHESLRFAELG